MILKGKWQDTYVIKVARYGAFVWLNYII